MGLKLGDHCEHVEQQPSHRVCRIMDRAAETELDVSPCELVEKSRVHRAAIEPAGPAWSPPTCPSAAGGQRQSQTGSVPVSASQAMVDVDAIVTDAERVQSVALGGDISLFC
jgi:hypothetical protein